MNNVFDGVVTIFGYLIVFVIGYLVYKNHQKKTQILAQTAKLSQIAENSYFEAFLDPHDRQKLNKHEVEANKLLDYIKMKILHFGITLFRRQKMLPFCFTVILWNIIKIVLRIIHY